MWHLLVDLYQVCSNNAHGVKTCPAPRVTSLSIGTKKENFKNLLLWNLKAWSLDIWYVASPSGPLPSLFKWCPWGQNWPHPGGHKFEHRNKIFFSETRCIELWYLLCDISLWTSTKIVHMMPLGSKLATPRGSQVWNIGTKKENFKDLLLWN